MQKLRNKLNSGVALVMIVLIPSFFALSWLQKPADKMVSQPQNILRKEKKEEIFWENIPQYPLSIKELTVYSDASQSKIIGKINTKSQLKLVELNGKSFKLADGRYISADKKQVISDVPFFYKDEKNTIYTHKNSPVFYSPATSYSQERVTELTGKHQFIADRTAQTYWGKYYEISLADGQKGWLAQEDTSLENPKLQDIQNLLNQKYNNPKYSIYVKILDSKFTAGVNQDEGMYAASLSKLPILYWTQKQLNEGKAILSDSLRYTPAVNLFYGSYQPEGTGNLPKTADNKIYSLQDIINRTAKLSDNVGSNLLAYYETQQFSSVYQKEINHIAGRTWNPKTREVSAQMVGKILEALYNEGGASFNALFNTNFDDVKIKAGLPKDIPVAHKIGGADRDNHDAAIIFTAEPYILVVESNGATDQEIQQISQDVYGVMK